MNEKVKEIMTGELINDIVYRAVKKMQAEELDDKKVMVLEKLARVHSIMNANAREAAKTGLYGSLTEKEMREVALAIEEIGDGDD